MAEVVCKRVKCQECGEVLDDASDTLVDERVACKQRGSKARRVEIVIDATLQLHSQVGIKARHGIAGRPFLESKVGDDQYRKTGEWHSLERVIDRENDRYKEIISNPKTGEVIHHCEEPLSQHQGHGSAKGQSTSTESDSAFLV